MNKTYYTATLSNGLKIAHMPSNGHVAHCGFFINVGTRDENIDEYGMAHFVEHMLFKGTNKRKAYQIINRMELVGGELNAFTNKEETVIYSTFLKDDYQRAIELLSDLVFNSQFVQNEIDKEIDVVIDEIMSYLDTPSEQIYDDFEDLIFNNQQLGHNILGNTESLQTFTTQKMKDFVDRCYSTKNMVFFSYGNISWDNIQKYAIKYLEKINAKPSYSQRNKIEKIDIIKDRENRQTSQAHVIIGGKSYERSNPNRKVLSLINNYLGGPGMNSRLNIALREKHGWVYNVESNFNSYSDIGVYYIYFGCNKKNVDKCINSIHKEISLLKSKELTSNQLQKIKRQYLGETGISINNTENLALALGKNIYHFDHINSLEEIGDKINAITPEMILNVSNEIFDENNIASLIFE